MIKNRIIELDIFRGIAVISVVLFHYTSRFNIAFETDTMKNFEFSFGHYGVQLFFIISGFVIFMTLERSKNTFDFIKRRFLRLYPTFWLSLIVTYIVTSMTGVHRFERTISDFMVNITMIPNLLGFRAIDGVYWSLQVELLFYFLMMILFQFKLLKYVFSLMFTWLFIGVLIHYLNVPYFNVYLITGYSYLFIAGISFYKIWTNPSLSCNLKYHFLILLCLIYGFAKDVEEGFASLLCFGLFYLFIFQKLKFIIDFKLFKPFVFLADISYSLYLIHQFIGMIIIFHLSKYVESYLVLLMAPIIISILLAWIIARFLEKSIQQKLKKMLFKIK